MALEVEIDVSKAQASLNQFRASLEGLGNDVDKAVNRASKSIERFESAIAKIKPIPEATLNSFRALGDATRSLGDISNLRGLSLAIERIVKLDMSRVAQQFTALSEALRKIVPPPGIANLATQLNAIANAANNAGKAALNTDRTFRKMGEGARAAHGSVSALGNTFGTARNLLAGFGVALGAVGFANFISEAFQAVTTLDAFANTVKAVEGSTAAVGKELGFISKLSKDTATDFGALASTFGKFSAAVITSGQSAQQAREIFESITKVARVLKLSGEDVRLSFLALEQMFSKGRVSSEELRRQLGERIPGAFNLFAKAAGVSTEQLNKMLQTGQVGIETIPKFAKVLEETFGGGLQTALQSAQAALTRFSNALFLIQESFGRAFFDAFRDGLSDLSEELSDTSSLETWANAGEQLGGVVNVMTTLISGMSLAFDALGNTITAAVNTITLPIRALDALTEALGLTTNATDAFMGAVKLLGTVLGTAGIIAALGAIGASLGLFPKLFAGAAAGATLFQRAMVALKAVLLDWRTLLISAVIGGIIFAIDKIQEFADEWRELDEAVRPTADALAEISPPLKKVQEEMSNFASDLGLSAEEATKFANEMVLAAAAPQDLAAATAKTVEALEKQRETLQKSIETLKERTGALIEASLADGQIDAAEQARIDTALEALKIGEDSLTQLDKQITRGQLLTGTYDQMTDATSETRDAVEKLVDSNNDGIRTWEEQTQALENAQGIFGRWGPFIQEFLGGSNDAKDAADQLGKRLDTMGNSAQETKPKLSGAAESMGQIDKASTGAADGTKKLADASEDAGGGLQGFLNAILGIGPAAANTFGDIGIAARDLMRLEEQERAAKESSEGLSGAFEKLDQVTEGVKGSLNQVGAGAAAENLGKTGQAATTAAGGISGLVPPITELTTKLGEAVTKLQEFFNVAGTGQSQLMAVANAIGFITTAITPLQTSIPVAQESLTALGTAASQVTPLIQPVAEQVMSLSSSSQSLTTSLPLVAQSFGMLMATLTQMVGVLQSVVTSFQNLNSASAAITLLQEAITKLTESVAPAQTASDNLAIAMGKVSESANSAVGGLRALEGGLDAAISGMERTSDAADQLAQAFDRMAEAARKAGEAAAKALADGAGSAGGGGDTSANENRIGGLSTDTHSLTRVPIKAFNNAPSLAGGTSTTNNFSRKLAGGGIPSILHPNEAVVPLSRGRKIPVDVQLSAPKSTMGDIDLSPVKTGLEDVASSLRTLSRAVAEPTRVDATELMRTTAPEPEFRKPVEVKMTDMPSGPPPMVEDRRSRHDPAPRLDRPDQSPAERNNSTDNAPRRNYIINMNINATDADSFRRTEEQIVRSLGQKIERATRRGG